MANPYTVEEIIDILEEAAVGDFDWIRVQMTSPDTILSALEQEGFSTANEQSAILNDLLKDVVHYQAARQNMSHDLFLQINIVASIFAELYALTQTAFPRFSTFIENTMEEIILLRDDLKVLYNRNRFEELLDPLKELKDVVKNYACNLSVNDVQ